MTNLKSPLEVIYDEILKTQDLDLVFRWIETHGFAYEKTHLKKMYLKGYEHAKNGFSHQVDDTYHQQYPNVKSKIHKP